MGRVCDINKCVESPFNNRAQDNQVLCKMFRNLALIRCGGVVNGGRKYLSTRQQQQKKEYLYDQDAYPAEPGFIRSSPYENIIIPNLTMDQYVWNNYRDWETKIATVGVNCDNLMESCLNKAGVLNSVKREMN